MTNFVPLTIKSKYNHFGMIGFPMVQYAEI